MSTKEKGPDEIFCRSCGEPIKKEAEICPDCGVRNQDRTTKNQTPTPSSAQHDPSKYDTTVSTNWGYGVLASIIGWVFLILVATSVPDGSPFEPILGLIAVIAWIIMPMAIYFDAKYVRANSRWNPSTVLYIIGAIIWLLNIIVGAVYIYRRHEALGEP
jgi:hypothetical protein